MWTMEFYLSGRMHSFFLTTEPSLLSPKPPILLLILTFYFSIHHYFEEYCRTKCREPKRTKRKQTRLTDSAHSSICEAINYHTQRPKWKKSNEKGRRPWNSKGIAFSTLQIWNHILPFSPALKQHDTALVACVVVEWKKASHLAPGSEL